MFDAAGQRAKQSSRGFVLERNECDVRTGAMVEDAEDGVQLALVISFAGEIEAPDSVLGSRCQFPTVERSAEDLDIVVMLADDPTHEGLAHGHAVGSIAAIEDHGDMPTSQIRALSFQFDDLLPNPFRLGGHA